MDPLAGCFGASDGRWHSDSPGSQFRRRASGIGRRWRNLAWPDGAIGGALAGIDGRHPAPFAGVAATSVSTCEVWDACASFCELRSAASISYGARACSVRRSIGTFRVESRPDAQRFLRHSDGRLSTCGRVADPAWRCPIYYGCPVPIPCSAGRTYSYFEAHRKFWTTSPMRPHAV